MNDQKKSARSPRPEAGGNIAIIMAVSLLLLLGIASLVVDGGYLYSEKDKFQNAVEAGALAGARYLHESAAACKAYAANIAKANGVPNAAALTVEIGYYDASVSSPVFTPDPDDTTPVHDDINLSNNAVRVSMTTNVGTMFSPVLPSGNAAESVSAKAVAYGKRTTFMSFGDEGISLKKKWKPGYNKYRDCILSSKGPVDFQGSEEFDRSWVETDATVTNGGSVSVFSPTETPVPPDIDWNRLRDRAAANGRIYDCASWPGDWTADDCSPPNYYKKMFYSTWQGDTNNYFFLPADGDHQGRVYFFDFDGAGDDPILRVWNDSKIPGEGHRTVYHFTLAARDAAFSTYPIPPSGPYHIITTIGDYPGHGNDGLVFIYCDKVDGAQSLWYTRYAGRKLTEPAGAILKMPGNFKMHTQGSVGDFYLRVHARNIEIDAVFYRPSSIRFMGDFGPVDSIRLGWP